MLSFIVIISCVVSAMCSLKNDKFCNQAKQQPHEELIDTIVEEISQRSKCLVFIFDTYYQNSMSFNWIRKCSVMPIYTIRIEDNESFFPPRNELGLILSQSKNAGCNAYVILVSNGLQVANFLQYIDEERLVNTRGLFLLLYDWRLFNDNLKRIWNRITNVVFLRRFSGTKRRSGERILHESFNLETVYYPVTVKGFVITRYLDTWYRGKFQHGINHFPSKTNDLRRKVLRVAVFQHIPAVTEEAIKSFDKFSTNQSQSNDEEQQTKKALGIEFEIMKIVAEKINFVPDFYVPYGIENARWGSAGENDSYDGLLGEAISGRASFFIGDLHYTLRHNRLLDLSLPYNSECLTFLTPEALTDNSWKLLIVPFTLYTWIAVMLTLILGASTFHLFALTYKKYIISIQTQKKKDDAKLVVAVVKKEFKDHFRRSVVRKDPALEGLELFTELDNSFLYTYSMMLQVSLPRIPTAWAIRLFIGWWWLYSILLTVAYRASMTATLANPIGRVTIDTISELAKSRIALGGWTDEQRNSFLASSDKDVLKIGERFELTSNEEEAIARVANGTFSYFENVYVLKQARALRQRLEYEQMRNAARRKESMTADRDLHVMQECLIDMPVSIGMDKNSPLKPQVDQVVRSIIEAGFVSKWLSDVTEWSRIVELRYRPPPEQTLVNLHKLHGALVALGIGYFLSLIALVAEILHWKYIVMRHPAYDKYHMDLFYANMKQ